MGNTGMKFLFRGKPQTDDEKLWALNAAAEHILSLNDNDVDENAPSDTMILQWGYWSETVNDGRMECEDDEPSWWWNKSAVPGAHHGWAYQIGLEVDTDYWTVLYKDQGK